MSVPVAGWYEAPQEPGWARYWDGELWTEQRRPIPPASDAIPLPIPPSLGGAPVTTAIGDGDSFDSQARALTDRQRQASGAAAAGGALLIDGVVGLGRRRKGVGGAAGTMLFGGVFLAVSFFIVPVVLDPVGAGAGEAEAPGVITQVNRDSDGMCSGSAEFTIDGATYWAPTFGSTSPCPISQGDDVTVIYSTSDPADAVIKEGYGVWLLFLLFPLVGVVAFLSGLWAFLKRATSIGAGAFLLTKGVREQRRLKRLGVVDQRGR